MTFTEYTGNRGPTDGPYRAGSDGPHGVERAAARKALIAAAQFFEYEMSRAWGGDARWISTGTHVADLVAEVLRERALEIGGDDV